MRQLLTFVFAAVALWSGGTARADEADDRAAAVARLEHQAAALVAERSSLERRYHDKTVEIASLKAERRSFYRDRRLEEQLAASKELANALETEQTRLRGLAASIDVARSDLIAAIDRALVLTVEETRRAQLIRQRGELSARLAGQAKKIVLPDDRIDPLDDPEDLEEKAARLARSETQLMAEQAKLDQRISYFERQARLVRSRARAEEADVFADDQPRRHTVAAARVATAAADKAAGESGRGEPTSTPPSADSYADGDSVTDDAEGLPADPSPTGGSQLQGYGLPPAITVAVAYSDLLEPTTLDAMKNAERSGDPQARAKAALRARAELRARTERLHQRRLEMEQRARKLRESKD